FELMSVSDYGLDLPAIAKLWNRGSVVRSWLLELTAGALGHDPKLAAIKGWVEDSGEGRWTIADAVEKAVPAPVITASLYARFRSGSTRPRPASPPRPAMPSGAMPSADDPFSLVIFGATGDLTRRKLIPALFALYATRTLPEPFAILAVARTEMSHDDFRRRMREAVRDHGRLQPPSEYVWERFAQALQYLPGDPKDPSVYTALKASLSAAGQRRGGPPNRLFSCATPPSLYVDIVENLGNSGLAQSPNGFARIVVEKPFGHDLESACALNRQLRRWFGEDQIYRIDHYLGKETVQNLLGLRFADQI